MMTISKQNTIGTNYFVFVETLVNEKWLLNEYSNLSYT
jgi:hypothetical protein